MGDAYERMAPYTKYIWYSGTIQDKHYVVCATAPEWDGYQGMTDGYTVRHTMYYPIYELQSTM